MENIRGSASAHLAGRRIVLGVCGSIAAVKAVELARELARHGADVVPVMTEAATRILHPDALHFATGNVSITRLSGAVEHVALLGKVKGRADLLLVAPATANTVSKMALGIDDSPVTTCATVAIGNHVPIVVAPAMHEVMLEHPIVAHHADTLRGLGITWVEPTRAEGKAKLADVEAIVEAVIHRLANAPGVQGPLAGQRALVISGSTAEAIDPVRVITNGSSGLSGILLATELHRLGATVTLWQGHATTPVPSHLENGTTHFSSHAQLMAMARRADLRGYDQVWMPAAIGDYAPVAQRGKIPSGMATLTVELHPLAKVIAVVRKRAPAALLVAFKAETDAPALVARARDRLQAHRAQFVVANLASSFGAATTTAHLVDAHGQRVFTGDKAVVMAALARAVAESAPAPARRIGARARKAARRPGA